MTSRVSPRRRGVLTFGLSLALIAACGGAPADSVLAPATTGDEPSSPSDDSFDGNTDGSSIVDNECANAVIAGAPVPVTMYMMFDKSGSMLQDQKWAGAKAALIAFFQDDDSAGLNVALRFFPDDAPVAGCNESSCNANACATPLVDAGVLNDKPAHSDPQQQKLIDAVESKEPGGQTPMFAALSGATAWATTQAMSNSDERTVVVLVTDGEPNGCNEDIGAIAGLSSAALDSTGILTYAIGMDGANQSQLNAIASAGGTDEAFVVGLGSVHKDLSAALAQIRTSALDCTFVMPDATEPGDVLDPKKVNVSYSAGDVTDETIGYVESPSACGADGGWYYDNPEIPSQIELCPASCDTVQDDHDATVEIVLGCETVVL